VGNCADKTQGECCESSLEARHFRRQGRYDFIWLDYFRISK
jgi:hypothetical protein